MHNILICDDNKDFLKASGLMLEKYADLYDATITTFDNGAELLEYCYNNKFDVIYLDVDLGKKNGLDIAKELKIINPYSLIIYISAYDIYYKDMVNAEPFRFVSKISFDDTENLEKKLVDALAAAIRRIDKQNSFTFAFDRVTYTIDLDRIKFFYSKARTIHINGDTDGAPSYFYEKMDDFYKKLHNIDANFVRISKSYIINIKYAARIYGGNKIKIDGQILSVPRKYRGIFKEYQWKVLF